MYIYVIATPPQDEHSRHCLKFLPGMNCFIWNGTAHMQPSPVCFNKYYIEEFYLIPMLVLAHAFQSNVHPLVKAALPPLAPKCSGIPQSFKMGTQRIPF